MPGITRKQFDATFSNTAIDLDDENAKATLAGAGLDVGKIDALDGKADGRVSGGPALGDLYDEIDRLDRQTSGLASKQELGLWGVLRGATVKPAPISNEQAAALAQTAHGMVAADEARTGQSPWSLAGTAVCKNPALSSPTYASNNDWKCNVFAGEAFYRAGVPFPLNAQSHYDTANHLPGDSRFFSSVARLDDVRPGDALSIHRDGESGHVEIVTAVTRGPDGRVTSLTTAGAHEDGAHEGTMTAAPLVAAARSDGGAGTATVDGETFRVLRPMAPPATMVGAGGRR